MEKAEVVVDESQLNGQDEDKQLLTRAVEWVQRETKSNGECPFCGKDFKLNDSVKPNMMEFRVHLKEQHGYRCTVAYSSKNLEASLINDDDLPDGGEYHKMAGIQLVDELDRHDSLFVSPELKAKVKREGGTLRWTDPSKVDQRKAQGAVVVERVPGQEGPRQGSTENTLTRANELVLMHFPAELAERRKRQKASRIDSQLQAAKEDIQQRQDNTEKLIYDGMIKQGQDKEVARQVSRAISESRRKSEEGEWRGADRNAHRGIHIREGRR